MPLLVMDVVPQNESALPLDELQIAPEWVRVASKTYDRHPGEEQSQGRKSDGRERRPRERTGPLRSAKRGPRGIAPRSRAPQRKPVAPAVAPVEGAFIPEEKGFAAMVEAMN